jgi:hypothetical protein
MLIANPIYDTVFKYLLEDIDIAKGLLSVILGVEIIELNVKPQETVSEVNIDNRPPINIYRLDFVAIVKKEDGQHKKILIELQKTKRSTNIKRFRTYLGENYLKVDEIIENGVPVSQPLEIVTIYFLGFNLDDVPVSILKVTNCFLDATTGNKLEHEPKDKFLRLLNHESYTIQIRKLKPNEKSRVEKILNIFSQYYITNSDQTLDFKGNIDDPLLEKIVNRLTRAIADETLRRQMNMEDEIETELQLMDGKMNDLKKVIEQKDQALEQKDQVIEQKDQVIEQKDQALEQKDQVIEQNVRLIEQKDQALEEYERIVAALKQQLEEKK